MRNGRERKGVRGARTVGNDRHCAPTPSSARQLRLQPPRLLPRLAPHGLQRRMPHAERDEVRVVLLYEGRELRELV